MCILLWVVPSDVCRRLMQLPQALCCTHWWSAESTNAQTESFGTL